MVKSQLVLRIAGHNPHLFNRDVKKVVDAILDEIESALARRDRVELRGLGAFFLRTRSARPSRNPRNRAYGQRVGEASSGLQDGQRNAPSTERDCWQRVARCVPQSE
jgi:integration host factor subunit beta